VVLLAVILLFGAIRPYKGLEHLVAAFQQIADKHPDYRLLIAGESKKGAELYLRGIQQMIDDDFSRERIIRKIEFIPDSKTELYFKAADVSVLPYNLVFQSGVLFLSYSFGLPVIATDVGSLREDIIEGRTGNVCRPRDPVDLASTIENYFESDLYKTLDGRREEIRNHANARNSWSAVAKMTRTVYEQLLPE